MGSHCELFTAAKLPAVLPLRAGPDAAGFRYAMPAQRDMIVLPHDLADYQRLIAFLERAQAATTEQSQARIELLAKLRRYETQYPGPGRGNRLAAS